MDKGFVTVSEAELAQVEGGVWPWVIVAGGYLIKSGFDHLDQISAGFKQGYREGLRR